MKVIDTFGIFVTFLMFMFLSFLAWIVNLKFLVRIEDKSPK